MRTSRADREPAIDALKVAYVQGRLTKDEFDERLGRALAPLTHAELTALTSDLPDGLATAGRPRGADQDMTQPREGNRGEARVLATLVAGVMLVALMGNGIGSPLHVLAIVLLLSPVWMLALGGMLLLHSRPSRPEDSSARQLPPGPPGAD
jgi:Flp pilus assembly protein TadB